jgi:putative hydrolase of the HAD superfamily
LDIGGVLLTNGWETASRKLAAKTFDIDYEEMDARHRLMFDTFEIGKITLEQYLTHTVFYKKRAFSRKEFEQFMFAQSQPHPEMIDYICKLKKEHHLKIGVVSNEGRELTEYRNHKFGLTKFVDFFIVSAFVHMKKPDLEIYRLALDVGQVSPEEVVYIDDRAILIEIAKTVGLHVIHHTSLESTQKALNWVLLR